MKKLNLTSPANRKDTREMGRRVGKVMNHIAKQMVEKKEADAKAKARAEAEANTPGLETPAKKHRKKVARKPATIVVKKVNRKEGDWIITDLCQTDAYKFSMGQLYFHRHPNEVAEWEFKLRSEGIDISELEDAINAELDHLCTLRFTEWDIDGIKRKMPWLAKDFVAALEDVQLKRKYITVTRDPEVNGGLAIRAYGPQLSVFWFEIYVLQIIQHLYFDDEEFNWEVAKANLNEVIKKWNAATRRGIKFTVSDFGIRRSINNE